jgi:transcriptional regulator with XRE-family HTH domain
MWRNAAPFIAKRLRKLRIAAGLSQQDLAVNAGLSLSVVGQAEHGRKSDPRVSTVRALAGPPRARPCSPLAMGRTCFPLPPELRELRQELLQALPLWTVLQFLRCRRGQGRLGLTDPMQQL